MIKKNCYVNFGEDEGRHLCEIGEEIELREKDANVLMGKKWVLADSKEAKRISDAVKKGKSKKVEKPAA